MATFKGSSGCPVLLFEDGKPWPKLVAVHRMHSRTDEVWKIGSIVNEKLLSRLKRLNQNVIVQGRL